MTVAVKSTHAFYLDIPVPLGKVVAEYRITPGSAIAYSVKVGKYIQIIDIATLWYYSATRLGSGKFLF
ncbi:hypothetical protein [Chroogloeocystis siderophila]|uniref:Uncharacterized protein n=1 Tax=Chroogloeocystis siderophila 5.2 s.c.1 TaxID=247279 RepID=A0A1U7I014_9CHRO|nr:hypothetical protein [Chroogloeocystis siderophila]OKH29197.1 hypothetical protein NIES1031_00985 [Chroogloeocystis siderophila 5.2 s.c.1]